MVQRRQEVINGRRVLRQADEDVAAGGLHVHRFEAVLLHVEVGAHFGAGEQQATVQLVGPLVVMADQLGDLAFFTGAQPRTAVAADVVERVHHAFGAANHDDRVLADLQGQVVALGRDLAGHAGDQPLFLEDFLHVDIKQPLVRVKRLRQRESALALLQHLRGGLACGFQRIAQADFCGDVHRFDPQGHSVWPAKVADQGCYARCKDCVLVWGECGAGVAPEPYPWATWPNLFPTRNPR